MASALYFELYEGGSLTKNTFDVYLDSSSDAVENSYYYNDATYTSQILTGTNGFSAWTRNAIAIKANRYRIRISYQGSLRFCSAWFKWSTNGYADYIPYYGTNGPSNGFYRIAVASNSFPTSRVLSGTTSLEDIPSTNRIIPCSIYLFWGGNYLSGGTTYPPIVGTTSGNVGSNYSMYVPSSTNNPTSLNYIMYRFYGHNPELPQCSYFNSYGLEGYGTTITPRTGITISQNLSFSPKEGVICTGRMAKSVSPGAKEGFNDNQCIPLLTLKRNGFISTETTEAWCLPRLSSVAKRYSIILNTVFITSGTVISMAYSFSGNSKSVSTGTVSFPSASSVSGCNWQAFVYNLLDTNYTSTDLNKSVIVTIGGNIPTISGWYYKVIAGDNSSIKITTPLNSSDASFTTTMGKLDGAVVFFSRTSNIALNEWTGKEKASYYNTISTHNECSWK